MSMKYNISFQFVLF